VTYRIVQWGTGSVGTHAGRTILERPDFELAGVRVYNPEKVGKDAGELLDCEPVGVHATDDDREGPLTDNCRLLASGKNVVSSAVAYHAVGINPGFAMDFWPTALSRVCRRIDKITVTEIVDMTRYQSIHMVRRAIDFGLPPDEPVPVDAHNADVYESVYYVAMRMLADAIGIELDEVRYHREVATTDRDIEIAAGTIEAGTVAAAPGLLDNLTLPVHGGGYIDQRVTTS
jgi:4-hydroxy-tetrahydrodipicolinate reductase